MAVTRKHLDRRRNADELTEETLLEEGILLGNHRIAEGLKIYFGGAPTELRLRRILAWRPADSYVMDGDVQVPIHNMPEDSDRMLYDPELEPGEWRVEGLEPPSDVPEPEPEKKGRSKKG